MKRLDIYIGKTVALAMLLASLGLVCLFALFTFLDQFEDIKKDYTFLMAARYIAYSTPRIFYETLPYAVLIGCLTGLGLLAGNSELIVMRSSSVSTWQISLAALKPALMLVIAGLLVGEMLLPDFERTARLLREQARKESITPQGGFWHRENNSFIHFNSVNPDGRLEHVSMYASLDQSLTRTLWAETAEYQEDKGGWLLKNLVITHLDDASKQRQTRAEMIWRSRLTPELLNTEILVEPDRMSILELYRKIQYMRTQNLNTGKFELGFWTKLFQPLASLSLVLVAISFIFGPLRQTNLGMRVVVGLVIGIAFRFLQELLSPASLVFGFPPLLATLIPVLLCVTAGLILLRRAN